MRAHTSYLNWPFDGLFGALAETYLAIRLEQEEGSASIYRLWPEGFAAAATLTHDVEGLAGQARCVEVADLEAEHGLRSCFNFVAERYTLDKTVMADLRSRGFEIGVHGVKHDGRKFSSRRIFEERLEALRRYQREWNADGFRSPATHRKWEWMSDLPFLYDSSYPDTDPYEPIPGGCGSPWPFRIGPLVELPITMPQDHTLWEILQVGAGDIWREKADRLRSCGGLINIIVHPDYLSVPSQWREYEDFLTWLRAQRDIWIALPRDIATWWQNRQVQQRVSLSTHGLEWEVSFH
jgi:peptidoglycan/xylan/chitin deacetylase (PgdA/CDA1 family)